MKTPQTWLFTTPITHRGLFDENKPENTAPAFLTAIENGYAIETDVQMTKDGVLVCYHDDNLKRLTGIDKDIRELNYSEIKDLCPLNKTYKILTFEEFLNLIDGKTPILIEMKSQKYPGLEDKLVEMLKTYKGPFAVQSFNPKMIKKVHKLEKSFTVGVLTTRDIASKYSKITKLFMRRFWFRFAMKFDFLSMRVKDIPVNVKILPKYKNIIAWIITNEEELLIAEKHAKNIIFEKQLKSLGKFELTK